MSSASDSSMQASSLSSSVLLSTSSVSSKPTSLHYFHDRTMLTSLLRSPPPSLSASKCGTTKKTPVLLILSLLLLSLTPSQVGAFYTNDGDDPISEPSTDSSGDETSDCAQQTSSCVHSFMGLLRSHIQHMAHNMAATTDKICLEYQVVLMCLHSALTDCPTMENLRRVQDVLSSNVALQINQMCAIHSTQNSRKDNGNTDGDEIDTQQKQNTSDTDVFENQRGDVNDDDDNDVTNRRFFFTSNKKSNRYDSGMIDYIDSFNPEEGDRQLTINVVTILQHKEGSNYIPNHATVPTLFTEILFLSFSVQLILNL